MVQAKRNLVLMLLIGAAALELTLFLNRGALVYDEAIYAQVAKEIVQRHDWLTLHWNGQPWFEKPPLYMWATALLFRLFGVSEFWARALSAACGVAVIAISFKIARIIYGRAAALLAILILLSTPLFVVYARFGTTDICLTFLVVLAFYGYLRSRGDARFWLLSWLAFGLAVMVKGAAGFAVVAVLGLALIIEGRLRRALSDRVFWSGLAVGVLMITAWHLAMIIMHGDNFVRSYFVRHLVQRSTMDLNAYGFGYAFYLSVLLKFFFPWVCLLPVALIFEAKNKSSLILIAFSALVLIVYTAVTTKFQWYILPAIPGFSIVVGGFLVQSTSKLRPIVRQAAYGIVTLLFIAGLVRSVIYSLPDPDLESASRLARAASADDAAITTYPNDLEMTVLFYSGRRLCAHPRPMPLPGSENTKCDDIVPRHIVFRKNDSAKVQTFYEIAVKRVDGNLEYAEILAVRK